MLIGRTDRGLLANWWFTVDHKMLSAVLLLMVCFGRLQIFAGQSPAPRNGLKQLIMFEGNSACQTANRSWTHTIV